jgi:phage gp46-like protein
VSDAYNYPRYSAWFDVTARAYEIVRWTSPREMEVVQVNIYTKEKAEQALAQWIKRAHIARSTPQ